MNPLPPYRYGAARTMVYLHEQYLQTCLEAWRQAKAANIELPDTDNPDYVSIEAVLYHVLSAARSYMVWMCEVLSLPDPDIDPPPPLENVAAEAEAYLSHLAARWRLPLAEVDEKRFEDAVYPSNWGVLYCVDAMLEHAVMHPILHQEQLESLLEEQGQA